MHASAYANASKFANKYLSSLSDKELMIIDFGSMDINGTMKPIFSKDKWKYIGVDLGSGKNVDVVATDPSHYPFNDNYSDVIVSSSSFEHDPAFWVTFKEMVRISKSEGYIYICTPSQGSVHRYPVDCWRFYPDAYLALSQWCPQAKLIEAYIDKKGNPGLQDNVGIFKVTK